MKVYEQSNADIVLTLTDNRDEAEDLSAYSRASFSIREEVDGSDIVTRSTDAANITIGASTLTITGITSGEWASLPPGTYLMDALLFHTAKSEWHRTERMLFEVLHGLAGVLP